MDTNRKIINPDFENWVNNNREFLRKYKGNWVTFNEELGFIAAGKTLDEAEAKALKVTTKMVFYYVNPHIYKGYRFLPIRFNTVKINTNQL